MRGALALALMVGLAGCSDEVTGELRLARPVTTTTARAAVSLWQYDRLVADGSADRIATFELVPVQQGVQAIPFSLVPTDADSALSHYVTASVDLDADGETEVGDFVVDDFNRVELGQTDVIVPLVPLAAR